ncbi:antitoxin Xre/MbcA/ParS toxin-binding domain-containing protein [Caulobacter sp. NIBR1757]|uniref:type II RES/Xre toxin-antitoxin system antitoxin n=1 Tax=Caulobacter sp. NIBR1757 TaxID=3016000 RepID=UPI0022F0ACF1|nr:antitoxin Xre/MbcA/ParS toxin-binding domain-containing protein [Caulobacter sp. NIBR1757]WGM37961.1 hypothetical protein AMEJIAPC_00862 [Caulobacter sp. NIBR1757]
MSAKARVRKTAAKDIQHPGSFETRSAPALSAGFEEAAGAATYAVGPADLLGGRRFLGREVGNNLDAHDLIVEGLPTRALGHLIDGLSQLGLSDSLDKAVGISLRTWQRRREEPARLLSPEQSGRTWKFAEILAHATAVFGSQAEAEAWLERPAMGLNQRRPIDLLATSAGVELVETHLYRIEYGVYM